MSNLPAPLVAADVDVSDMPLPREAFVRMAMEQFGMLPSEAERLIDEVIASQERH